MQNNNRGFLAIMETYIDMIINIVAIFASYVLTVLIFQVEVIPLFNAVTVAIIFANILLISFTYNLLNMYRANRYAKTYHSFPEVLRANLIYFGIMAAISAVATAEAYRAFVLIWILFVFIMSTAFLTFKRHIIKVVLKTWRSGHYNLRKVIIVGDNTQTAAHYIKQVQSNPDCGIMVLGYVGDKISPEVGTEKLGPFKDLAKILDKYHPTEVVFAIDGYDKRHLIKLVNMCDDRCIKVYFLPVIYGFFKNSRQIEQVGNLPVINIHSTPLDNTANAFIKRLIDIVGSLILIVLTSPIMLFAAIGVRLTSPGPIFFKQVRVGRLGKKFTMLKFRSMRVNSGSNDRWTTGEDERKTKFGTFLRRTAIDELPQLFNVLGGSMSLVGPRPELPKFVEYFKNDVPLYMIKHYVKPGITGLAQIKGLRGDTSIEDRIQEDISYIENWSLMLDIYILLMTPFKAFNKNEKYVGDKKSDAESKETAEAAEQTDAAAEPEKSEPEDLALPAKEKSEESSFDVVKDAEEAAEEAAEPQPENAEPNGEVESKEVARPLPEGAKKILYVASTMSHINNFHLDYIEALRAAGNEVKTLAAGAGADYNIPFEKKYISFKNMNLTKEIRRIVETEKFDTVIMNTTLAAFYVRMALPKKDRPTTVNVVHGYLFSRSSGTLKKLVLLMCEKLQRSKTDSIVVMNKEDLKIARDNRLTDGGIFFCNGMGVKPKLPTRPADEVRREYASKNAFVLCFVGELSARKNQEFLITALPQLREYISEIKLWLVGDGDKRQNLEDLAEKLGVAEVVTFLGQRSDAADFISACDVYVSASQCEGLPFNIAEAMALGKPIVASGIKGNADMIEDGKSGLLYELGELDGYIDCIMNLRSGKIKLSEADIRARFETYSYKNVFPETLNIITEASQNAGTDKKD